MLGLAVQLLQNTEVVALRPWPPELLSWIGLLGSDRAAGSDRTAVLDRIGLLCWIGYGWGAGYCRAAALGMVVVDALAPAASDRFRVPFIHESPSITKGFDTCRLLDTRSKRTIHLNLLTRKVS